MCFFIMFSSKNIILGKDGKYRWVYEVHLLKNYVILWEVYRVFAITAVICYFLVGCIGFCSDGFDALKSMVPSPKYVAIVIAAILVVGFLGYFLYAAINGWKYCVRFTMDDKEVVHEMMPKHAKKAQVVSTLTVLAGLLSGRPGTVGAGMLAARTTSVSTFSDVRKVKGVKKRNLIKVNERLSRNQVYVEKEDFDFVYNYICEHCPNAKKC